MAEPKPNEFHCDDHRGGVKVRVIWRASRPEALAVLREISACTWGVHTEFHGTEAELIAAGVATPDMFKGMGKSGQRTRHFSFGDEYTVKRRRGQWDLTIRTHNYAPDGLPTDEHPAKSNWWKKYCAATGSATAEILARFARKEPEGRRAWTSPASGGVRHEQLNRTGAR